MSGDELEPADETAAVLRAKAAHCIDVAPLMGSQTRARLVLMAGDCLERAVVLESNQQRALKR